MNAILGPQEKDTKNIIKSYSVSKLMIWVQFGSVKPIAVYVPYKHK